MDLQRLSDERDIIHGLGRFARIADRREWDGVGDVFAEDVSFDYGDGQEQQGIAAMRAQFARFLGGCGPSQHLIGSIIVSVDGDRATSHAYVQARHQGAGAKSRLFLDSSGEYIDQWERRAAGWRIVRRDAKWFTQKGDFSVLGPSSQETF